MNAASRAELSPRRQARLGVSSAARILERLLDGPSPVTRPELAAACGLSRPTVFTAVADLERLGLVECTGRRSGLPGRSAQLYKLSPAAGRIAAIDIGAANLRAATCDLLGTPVAEVRRATSSRGGAPVVRQAVALLAEAEALAGPPAPVLAIGVSVPGIVDHDNRVVRHASNLGLRRPYDFQTRFEELLSAPVLLENNVNLAAIGEQWRGSARELATFAVIAVGAGVGAGIVHDRALLRGARGGAGEVGLLTIRRRAGAPPAAPGEDAAGAVALLREARSRSDWRGSPPRDVAEIFERAAQGEPPAVALVEDEYRRVGEIIATICAVVDPEAVILTGGLGNNEALVAGASAQAATLFPSPPPVLRSALGERASLVGATALAAAEARAQLLARADG